MVLVASAAFAGVPVAADRAGSSALVDEDEADATLEDGETYYQGMELYRNDGVSADDELEVVDGNGELVTLAFADADGEVILDTGEDTYESGKQYTLLAADGDEIATFRLIEQSLTASFDAGSVDTSGDDTTATLSVSSNRRDFDLVVSAKRDGSRVDPGTVRDVLGDGGTPVDSNDDGVDDAVRYDGAPSTSWTADFDDEDAGSYTFTASVPDTGATDSASIDAGGGSTGEAILRGAISTITDQRGDVPVIPVTLGGTNRVTITIGSDTVNYELQATVVDQDGDGSVDLRWNTDEAGRRPASEVVSAVGDDRVVSATRIRGGISDSRRIAEETYPVSLSVGGTETDRGQVDLIDPNQYERRVSTLATSSDTASSNVVDAANPASAVSYGNYVVIRVESAGIHGVIQSKSDLLAERDGVSVEVRETVASAAGSPRTRVDVETLQFVSRPEENALYLYARTNAGDFEAGDTYQVTFRIDESNPYVDADVTRQTTFEVTQRQVRIFTGMGDTLRVQPDTERICGQTTLPEDEQLSLRVQAVGGGFRETKTATVGADGRYCAEFDFSDQSVGQGFTVTAIMNGNQLAQVDGEVAERGTVSLSDQRAEDGRFLTVDSARLPNGGFVVIKRASDGAILGWSKALQPGAHQDVSVTLEDSLSQTTQVRAVIHQNNGPGTFDPADDLAYEYQGSEVSATAQLQVGATTTTTSGGTTTTTTTTTSGGTTTTTTTTTTPPTETTTTTTTGGGGGDGDGGSPLPVPGFGIGVAVVAILAALLTIRRSNRN